MTETTGIYKLLKPLGYTKGWNHQDIQILILVYLSGFCKTTSIYKLLKPLDCTKGWNHQDNKENTCISKWFLSNHLHIQITETSRLYKRLEQPEYTKKKLVYLQLLKE